MPQFSSYPTITNPVSDDLVLIHQASSGLEKTVKYSTIAQNGGYVINVKDFGAVADGTTDDSAAIQAAINSAVAGSYIVFPQSDESYIIDTQINIPTDYITIVGFGAVLSGSADTEYQKFYVGSRTGIVFDGLVIDGQYSSMATGIGAGAIHIYKSKDVTVTNCTFKDIAQSGVFVQGNSSNVKIIDNRFSGNFCAIFIDDADGAGATGLEISRNHIKEGLGTTSTAYSGGVKISGAGSTSTKSCHIISDNTITTAGEMGIELQTFVNDCSISGNAINGTGFGISLSGVYRTSIVGNAITATAQYGIEAASNSNWTTMTGNTINSSSGKGITVVSGAENTSITGGSITGGVFHGIYVNSGWTSISGVTIADPIGSSMIVLHNAEDVSISGCYFNAINIAQYAIFLDCTDADVNNVSIVGNYFTGDFQYNGLLFYHPNSYTINDVLITGNNTSGAYSAGAWVGQNGASSVADHIIRVRCFNNLGQPDVHRSFNINPAFISSNTSFPYDYWFYDSCAIHIDASGGDRTFELPPAIDLSGWNVTIVKGDSSTNVVTVKPYGTDAINDQSSFTLRLKDQTATFLAGDGGWRTTSVTEQANMAVTAYRSSNQTIPSGVETDMVWTGVYGEGISGWTAGTPANIVVPSGARRVRLTAGIRWDASSAGTYRFVKIKSNNPAATYPANSVWASDFRPPDTGIAPGSSCTLTTPIINVAEITDFYVSVSHNTGSGLDVLGNHGGTYFQLEVID